MSSKSTPAAVTTTTYVAYLLPGSLVNEESVREVAARNPEEDIKNAHEYAFAFFYFDIVRTVVKVGSEKVETKSGRRNISGRYYIDGEVLDLKAVEALEGDHSTLIGNMQSGDYEQVVRCRTGNFQVFDKNEDVLLTAS